MGVCSVDLMKKAGNIAGQNLLSFGTCFGKFTKTRKFRLHVTALDYLAPYAKVCTTGVGCCFNDTHFEHKRILQIHIYTNRVVCCL